MVRARSAFLDRARSATPPAAVAAAAAPPRPQPPPPPTPARAPAASDADAVRNRILLAFDGEVEKVARLLPPYVRATLHVPLRNTKEALALDVLKALAASGRPGGCSRGGA